MLRLIKTSAIAACVAVLAVPAMAQTKWNLPAAYPADNPHSVNLIAFAKDVSDATGGKRQITVHPAASLFKAPEIKRAVATARLISGALNSVAAACTVICSLPPVASPTSLAKAIRFTECGLSAG